MCVASLCVLGLACRDQTGPTKDTPPAPSGSAAVAVAPSASASAAPAPLPTLLKEKFEPGGAKPTSAHAVDGALMVVDGTRVGRVVGDGVEWVEQKIPPDYPAFGPNGIDSVHGWWPDGIGVIYSNRNGRAPQPRYTPLTGKGVEHVVGGGGGLARIAGVARVADATLLVAYDNFDGLRFAPVRGSLVRKPQSPAQAGCKEGEIERRGFANGSTPAITPEAAGGTQAGTLMTIGNLCEKRPPAAEIWDKAGKSRIVDLSRWWKRLGFVRILEGKGDELWAMADRWSPLLHYKDGELEALPPLERPVQTLVVSARGEMHASDGHAVHRWDGKAWVTAAHFAEAHSSDLVMDEQDGFWTRGVYRLRAAPGAAPTPPPAPEACAGFVYLYEASYKNGPKFTYPDTRKALSSFPEASALGLVEFGANYDRHLGVTVASRAQGEALAAHIRATMKNEEPRVFCFDPKSAEAPRSIPLDAKK
jgi:hypothetical protein